MWIQFSLVSGKTVSTEDITMEFFDTQVQEAGATERDAKDSIADLISMVWDFPKATFIRVGRSIYNPAAIESAQILDYEDFAERFPDLKWPHLQD
jgi:hypothetical protein